MSNADVVLLCVLYVGNGWCHGQARGVRIAVPQLRPS